MKDQSIWQIKIPSLESYIQDPFIIEDDEQYSILKHARRQENEIAEISAALGANNISSLITFKPRRLAFYETIVRSEIEIKLDKEEDLFPIVMQIYSKHVVPILKSKNDGSDISFEKQLIESIDNKTLIHVNSAFKIFEYEEKQGLINNKMNAPVKLRPYLEEIIKTSNIINCRIREGLFTPGEYSYEDNKESIIKKIVFDRFYNLEVSKKVEKLIEHTIIKLIEDECITYPNYSEQEANRPLQRIPHFKDESRHTFMMIGAPASGKGTALGMIIVDAERLGISYSDFVKINTDTHRNFVSVPEELGSNVMHHSRLNCDESYLITQMVFKRIETKIQSPEGAPHIYMDTVYLTQKKIDLSTMGEGNLHINCVTSSPDESVKRAFLRGVMTGRYVDTSYLLKSHRDVSKDFHIRLSENSGKNIDYVLVDNNVPEGEIPTLVEEGNLRTGTVKVHDKNKLKDFLYKKNINVRAINKTTLYISNNDKRPHVKNKLAKTKIKKALMNASKKNITNSPSLNTYKRKNIKQVHSH